jgi:hypothetical protein
MDQRGGMPMHLPQLRSVTPKDPGHAHRPVLVRQPADLTMLTFDHHQHDQIAGRVGLHDVQFCFAVREVALRGLEAFGRGVVPSDESRT